MSRPGPTLFSEILFYTFALFIFGSTFSIALAQISLGLSLVLFLIIVIVTRYNPFPQSLKWFYLFLALYIVWMLLSALVGPTPMRSAWIIKEEWLFCIIPIGIFLFARPRYRDRLITVLGVGILLISLYGITQHFTGIHWFKELPPNAAPDFGYMVCGNFSHQLTFGNYYGTAAAFLAGYALSQPKRLSRQERLVFIVASLLGMIATVLSYSRGPAIGLAIALVVMGVFLGRRYLVYSLGIVAVLAISILVTMPGLTGRFSNKVEKDLGGVYEGGRVFIWQNSVRIIGEHPLFGVGQGNFKAAYTSFLRPDIPEKRKLTHAHNDLLNVAAIAGIPGALFFAGMWLAVFIYLWNGWRNHSVQTAERSFCLAALLGSLVFFVTSLVEATFADEEVRQLLMFIWAAGLWPWYKNVNDPKTPMHESA